MRKRIKKILDRLTFLRSLGVLFFIIIFLVGVVPCVLLQNAILRNYEERAVEVRVEQVKGQLRSLANHLINSNYLVNHESGQVDAELSEFATLYDGRLMIIDPTLTVVKDTYGLSENKTIVSQDVITCLLTGEREGSQNYDRKYGFIEIVVPITETRSMEGLDYYVNNNGSTSDEMPDTGSGQSALNGENSQSNTVLGVLLASTSTEYIQKTKDILRRKALMLQTVMLIVVFLASIIISRMLVRPFEVLSRDILEVKEGYSNEPISAPRYLETMHIADSFNTVLARMNALDQSRQEFVANVSHELKTPMTSMKVLAASLLSEEDVDPAVYREFLEDIDSEIDRENKIISDLLALVKEDRTNIDLEVTETDINALAEAVMKRMRPIAEIADIGNVRRPVAVRPELQSLRRDLGRESFDRSYIRQAFVVVVRVFIAKMLIHFARGAFDLADLRVFGFPFTEVKRRFFNVRKRHVVKRACQSLLPQLGAFVNRLVALLAVDLRRIEDLVVGPDSRVSVPRGDARLA